MAITIADANRKVEEKSSEKLQSIKDKGSTSGQTDVSSAEEEGAVFGSFNLQFPTSAIERDRSDGATLINLMPECRVFICGGEISKDITAVSVNMIKDGVSTCSINIANPRGKYNITTSDLVGGPKGSLWREDKSIQATYDYDWLKKQVPGSWTDSKEDPGNTKSQLSKGKKLANTIVGKQVTSTVTSVFSSIKNRTAGRTKGFTQMLYEVKQQSQVHKAIGETVFDYRDPVQVFFKGRFSTYWYFGFSGVIEVIDNAYTYGAPETITLQCMDVIGILRRKKWTEQGSLLDKGNLEAANDKVDEGRATNFTKNPDGTFSDAVKQLMWVSNDNYVKAVENSHFYYTTAHDATVNWSAVAQSKKAEKSNSKEPIVDKATFNVREPYSKEYISNYYQKFKAKHPFDRTHKDLKKERNNSGKQFREFYLTEDPTLTPDQELAPLEAIGLEFIGGTARYMGEKEIPKTVRGNIPPSKERAATATRILTDMVNTMKTVLDEATSEVSWTVVGHIALISSAKQAMRVKNVFKSELPEDSWNSVDLGPHLMDYSFNCSATGPNGELCLSKPCSPNDWDGAGLQVSIERAHRVLMDLQTIAGELAAKDPGYTKVNDVLKKMESKGVGRFEPKDSSNTPITFKAPKTPKEAKALEGVLFVRGNTKSTVNQRNRYVQLVPTQTKYTKKAQIKPRGNSDQFVKDPHSLHFSPNCAIYMQLNEININDFTPENLEVFYKTSVRYWLRGPGTTIDKKQLGDANATGWKHTEGFGVCGTHPAMTYDFLDNFNVLPYVHEQTRANLKVLDGCTLTPLEILRETIFGVGTELDNNIYAKKIGIGTQHNYFRPRLFLVTPKKFRTTYAYSQLISEITAGQNEAISTWEALQNLIVKLEYTIYSSPMGDIFIEPLMHDFHPLNFYGKLDKKSICPRTNESGTWCYKGVDVYFRTTTHTTEGPIVAYRTDKAYIFNTKVNHPYFITDKDLKRVTDTIKPENLISHVTLFGSTIESESMGAAISNTAISGLAKQGIYKFLNNPTSIGHRVEQGKLILSDVKDNPFTPGMYFANGFTTMREGALNRANGSDQLKKELHDKSWIYQNKLSFNFTKYKKESSLESIIQLASIGVDKIIKEESDVFNVKLKTFIDSRRDPAWAPSTEIAEYIFIPPSGTSATGRGSSNSSGPAPAGGGSQPSNASSQQGNSTTSKLPVSALNMYETALLHSQCPKLFDLYTRVLKAEVSGDTSGIRSSTILEELNISTVKQGNGLLSLLVSKLTYGPQNTRLSDNTDLNLALAHLTNDLTDGDLTSKNSRSYTNDVIPILAELLLLYELISLTESAPPEDVKMLQELNQEIITINKKITSFGKLDGVFTRADLKAYENAQLYDPSKNFVGRYGWNPGPNIETLFVNNGAEAEAYCKVIFDKINASAFEIKCDLIGRAELGLNRPYYVEKNQTIGLCSNYTISYNPSSLFSSSATLTFLRRNSLTYSYTLNNLDKIVAFDKDSKDNKFFNTKALNFYKSLYSEEIKGNRYKMLDKVIPIGGASSAAKFVVSKVSAKDKNKSIDDLDGIYVAHDWIGHTDYDHKFHDLASSKLYTQKVVADAKITGLKYISSLGNRNIKQEDSMRMVEKNNQLHTSFLVLQAIEKDHEQQNFIQQDLQIKIKAFQRIRDDTLTQLKEVNSDINTINSDKSITPDPTTLKHLFKKRDIINESILVYNDLLKKANAEFDIVDMKLLETKTRYTKITKLIYGSAGVYTPQSERNLNTLGSMSIFESVQKEEIMKKDLTDFLNSKKALYKEAIVDEESLGKTIKMLEDAGTDPADPDLVLLKQQKNVFTNDIIPTLKSICDKAEKDIALCDAKINDLKESTKTAYPEDSATSLGYTVDYYPNAHRRSNKDLTYPKSLFYQVYMAIPEKDINGVPLRVFCKILDDVGTISNTTKELTGKIDNIPLYIQFTDNSIDKKGLNTIDNVPSSQGNIA